LQHAHQIIAFWAGAVCDGADVGPAMSTGRLVHAPAVIASCVPYRVAQVEMPDKAGKRGSPGESAAETAEGSKAKRARVEMPAAAGGKRGAERGDRRPRQLTNAQMIADREERFKEHKKS
jgi:hypothetical protein